MNVTRKPKTKSNKNMNMREVFPMLIKSDNQTSSSNMDFNLTDYQDLVYTVEFYFGSNKQPVTLDLDTGSSDLWIGTTECTSCQTWKDASHKTVPLFNTKTSTSYKEGDVKDITVSYGSGNISGNTCNDDIYFSTDSTQNNDKINLNFMYLTYADMQGGFHSTGLAGMSFHDSQQFKTTLLIEAMVSSKIIDKGVFMFNMLDTQYHNVVDYKDGVIFGSKDIDEYLKSDHTKMNYIPVKPLNTTMGEKYLYWTTEMTDLIFEYDNKLEKYYSFSAPTIVDTGTSLIYLNSDLLQKLAKQLNNHLDYIGQNVFSCPDDEYNKLMPIEINLGGNKYYIPKEGYFERIQGNLCQLMILPSDQGIQILGDTFIKYYDTVFDYDNKRMAFRAKMDFPNYTVTTWMLISHWMYEYRVLVFILVCILVGLIVWAVVRCRNRKKHRDALLRVGQQQNV